MSDSKTGAELGRRKFLIATGAAATAAWAGVGTAYARPSQEAGAAPASPQAPPAPALEQRMAQFAAGVRYDDLPVTVVQACKRLLLDALACAFGAVKAPAPKITEAAFRKAFGADGNATIIGNPHKISTEGATLMNGILIRELEFNDIYFGKDPAHPSEIISAAIACCEDAGRSGRDLIEALTVGYEAEIRLDDAIAWGAHGLISSSAAAFVVPLIAGKAWRMSVEQVANAVGISGPRQLTTLAVTNGEISMMKSVGPGYTAMDAVFSTRLAAAGLTGVQRSIEWLTANIQPTQQDINIDFNPGQYLLTKVGLRRFPLQGDLQAVAEAGVNLHAKIKAQGGTIEDVVAEEYPGTIRRGVASQGKYHPANRGTADHSLPVCLAMALLDGDVTPRQFDEDRWKAPDVLALAQKVKAVPSQALVAQMPDGFGSIVTVRLSNGQTVKETVLIPEGDAAKPMSRPVLEHKFRTLAEPVIGTAGASKVIDYVDHLENVKDIRIFTAALRQLA